MPIFRSVRTSPSYLYLKAYLLASLVSLFQAAPVSSRLPPIHARHRLSNSSGRLSAAAKRSHSASPTLQPSLASLSLSPATASFPRPSTNEKSRLENGAKDGTTGSLEKESQVGRVVKRWCERIKDLSQVRKLLEKDYRDLTTYPELEWDAQVRRSSSLHPLEKDFIEKRKRMISSLGQDSLSQFLQLPKGEKVHPDDVPMIAIGGSGGGYRATFGFLGFLSACKDSGLWSCTTWVSGVSGSCWTLIGYYTISNLSFQKLIAHYMSMAKEGFHPLSVQALDTIARTKRGVYFLLGPLLKKAFGGSVGLGVMDLYATMTTCYQLLPRSGNKARLSRATFQFSRVWDRAGIDEGLQPLPILSAVRVSPPGSETVPGEGSEVGRVADRAPSETYPAAGFGCSDLEGKKGDGQGEKEIMEGEITTKGYFQWFEISPLEVGSESAKAWIPTWSFGRNFLSGRSLNRSPEHPLSLILGQCTSAPAGPLTGYISAMLASLPRGTIMSKLLLHMNNFVRMKRWERRWGNPIRAADEPNPFYGLNDRNERASIVGVGVDIIHLKRLDQLVERHSKRKARGSLLGGEEEPQADTHAAAALPSLNHLARRILCQVELEEWEELMRSFHADLSQKLRIEGDKTKIEERLSELKRFLAVRWSAKEAAYKAFYPHVVLTWKDLCVSKRDVVNVDGDGQEGKGEEQDDPTPSNRASDKGGRVAVGKARGGKPFLGLSEEWERKNENLRKGSSLSPKLFEQDLDLDHGEKEDGLGGDFQIHPMRNWIPEQPRMHLSISHDGEYVVSNVLVENKGRRSSAPILDLEDGRGGEDGEREEEGWIGFGGMKDRRIGRAQLHHQRLVEERDEIESSSGDELKAYLRRGKNPLSVIKGWETNGRIKLMDSGMSNNLPNHILARKSRKADILISLDASSDVKKGSALKRLFNFSNELGILLRPRTNVVHNPYARVMECERKGVGGGGFKIVYCPLLPSRSRPDFDPTTSDFSTSYNLVWTPGEVETLVETSVENFRSEALSTIREVVRQVYVEKRDKRLKRERSRLVPLALEKRHASP